jgi:CDP-diacylglycerol--serine O-phosphatidyltransferase
MTKAHIVFIDNKYDELKSDTVMLQKFKRQKYSDNLELLPKISISADNFTILKGPTEYRQSLLELIKNAKRRIYLIALYLEQDDAGKDILSAIYQAKQQRPDLDVAVLVDWHRAQRGRIGDKTASTNADWYCAIKQQYPGVSFPVYGVPINTREALGVLHLKGSVIDDTVAYTGASINDVYLHRHDKYRYDRYQLLHNQILADSFVEYVQNNLISTTNAVNRLDDCHRPRSPEIKRDIRKFRQSLRKVNYEFIPNADNHQLAVTPLVGLGKNSLLNQTIRNVIGAVNEKLVICTPYFNLPVPLVKGITRLLRSGKKVEIIVGDKTANDFYIPESEPFKIIGALPYLYEINLRKFIVNLQDYVDKEQLIVRLWRDDDNTYHLKGMWADNDWFLITGNNLNPRAVNLDLENGILIHDPHHELQPQIENELDRIRTHTTVVSHYQQLQSDQFYPPKVHKLLRRLRRAGVDKIVSRIL